MQYFPLIKSAFYFNVSYMGYIFNCNDAVVYEQWLKDPKNQMAAELENRLMLNMLRLLRGDRLIDIGCGTGTSLLPFLDTGVLMTGLDPSPDMIDIASEKLENRAELYQGFAEDLPFEDNAFHHACLVKTLEFADDPRKAIEEACRVAKNMVFIGILNRHSIRGTGLRVKRIFTKTIYDHARFFSIWELEEIIRTILGDVPISWRTVCQFSAGAGKISHRIECSDLVQRCPFGAFTGMTVTLVPRFRTLPLEIPCPVGPDGTLTGLARTRWR
ncbi:class I SAM-dependent methyltransferase [Desulfococcaceae bacterium HSG8]|nr:class I SAM-dependent methyltransferase [Desulfococcaceae bacterium HSG8]